MRVVRHCLSSLITMSSALELLKQKKNSTPENQTGKGQFRDSETFGKKFETLGRQKNTQKTRLRDSKKTLPRFRDLAKTFRDPCFSRYHSPPLVKVPVGPYTVEYGPFAVCATLIERLIYIYLFRSLCFCLGEYAFTNLLSVLHNAYRTSNRHIAVFPFVYIDLSVFLGDCPVAVAWPTLVWVCRRFNKNLSFLHAVYERGIIGPFKTV